MLNVSMQIDGSGRPHIAAVHRTEGKLYYMTKSAGVWTSEEVDYVGTGASFFSTSLALDADDNPVIAYDNADPGGLRLATRSAGSWVVEYVTPLGSIPCTHNSLGLLSDGTEVIAYAEGLNQVMLATRTETGWDYTEIEAGYVGAIELAIDALDRVHVIYGFTSHGPLLSLQYWLDGMPNGQLAGSSSAPSIRPGPNGGVLICYRDRLADALNIITDEAQPNNRYTIPTSRYELRCSALDMNLDGALVASFPLEDLRAFSRVDGHWPWLELPTPVNFDKSFAMDLTDVGVIHVVLISETRHLVYATLEPTALSPPVVVGFDVDPPQILEDLSADLQWSISHTELAWLEPNAEWIETSNGTLSVLPAETTTYTLRALNFAGSDVAQTTLEVIPFTDPPIIEDFHVEDPIVRADRTTTLHWSTTHADEVRIEPFVGIVETSGSHVIHPQMDQIYQLTATNEHGSSTSSVHVFVIPAPLPTIESFVSTDQIIAIGDSTVLSWSVIDANTVSIVPTLGTVASNGRATVAPIQTTTYLLLATNAQGSTESSLTVTVIDQTLLPTIVQFEPVEPSILLGESGGLRFQVADAELVHLEPGGIDTPSPFGEFTVQPSETTTYTLTASNSAGIATAEATLVVDPFRVSFFESILQYVGRKETTKLRWEVIGQATVELAGVGPQPLVGQIELFPAESRIYTLISSYGAYSEEHEATVYVGEYDYSSLALSWSAETYLTVSPPVSLFTPFTVELLGVSLDAKIAGLEFRLVLPPDVVLLGATFHSSAPVNVGSGTDFIIGLGECLPVHEGIVHLATFELLVTDVTNLSEKQVTIGPIAGASLPGEVSYASCVDQLLPTATGFPLPLDGEGASVPVIDLSFSGRRISGGVELSWRLAGDAQLDRFEIHRRSARSVFRRVGEVAVAPGEREWVFVDLEATEDRPLHYRLLAMGPSGVAVQQELSVSQMALPKRMRLQPNSPNPFNPSTRLRFEADVPGRYKLAIFDLAGKRVRDWTIHVHEPGVLERSWDGRDRSGRLVSSGNYLLQLEGPGGVDSASITLLK